MFIIVLFILNALLFSYILLYGICLISLPFIRPQSSAKLEQPDDNDVEGTPLEPVTILVPCHFEGEAIVRTIRSTLEQDYRGSIKSIVLIRDPEDSSFEPLQREFGFVWGKREKRKVVHSTEGREVEIFCVGASPKREKLNAILPELKDGFVAFLDADHRAESGWIRQSIALLQTGSYVGIQSRRAPLSLATLPQLWDGAQNHIGNELVNRALDRTVGAVFFTGTTCVFRASEIAGRTFGDCVTEDTYFSYELLSDGKLIGYNPDLGSREEVAPDMRSYIARRRRWSCGHNKTFFTLGKRVLKAPIPWRNKAATLLHGLFYTVPIAVCLLLNLYSLHMFVQYTGRIQATILLFTATVSILLSQFIFGWHRSIRREWIALFVLLLPQVSLFAPAVLYLLEHELTFFLVSFPYAYYLFWSHSFCLFAPLLLLIFGARKVPVLRPSQLFTVAASYPIFFLLDLYACVLGFVDFVIGRPTWSKINRTHVEAALLEQDLVSARMRIVRWAGAIVAIVALVIGANDLTAYSNCGEPKAHLFDPILFVPRSNVTWDLVEQKQLVDSETLKVDFTSSFTADQQHEPMLQHFINGEALPAASLGQDGSTIFSYTAPVGWQSVNYSAKLKFGGDFCSRDRPFTTSHREIRDNQLYVNGEPFLVKGVIPSFSPNQTTISSDAGMRQIKELGANALRFYHASLTPQQEQSAKHHLLIIDQPNRSTWDEVNLLIPWQRSLLQKRFEELIERDRGFPFLLFHTVGNELEIRNPRTSIPRLQTLLEELKASLPGEFFAYSTFYVYLKLPSAIYGLNMLDSGKTYWEGGLKTIQALNKPFYASEFGGFVAAFERTPELLRSHRIFDYWERIRDAGGFGIVIHQSHDNWSQPLVNGFNDPFSPDQPDDERGIWNTKNEAKKVKRFLEMLFADLDVLPDHLALPADSLSIPVTITNRRPYRLVEVSLARIREGASNETVAPTFSLAPHETIRLTIARGGADPAGQELVATYSTHSGLAMQSRIHFVAPISQAHPVLLNTDWTELHSTPDRISGKVLRSSELRFTLPSAWQSVVANGKQQPVSGGVVTIPVLPSMQEVVQLEASSDSATWAPTQPGALGDGPQRVRFKLPERYSEGALLLLAGLGTKRFHIRYGPNAWQEMESHVYRENLLDVTQLLAGAPAGDFVYLLLPRTQTQFIGKRDHPTGETIKIEFETPRVFAPTQFELRNGSSS